MRNQEKKYISELAMKKSKLNTKIGILELELNKPNVLYEPPFIDNATIRKLMDFHDSEFRSIFIETIFKGGAEKKDQKEYLEKLISKNKDTFGELNDEQVADYLEKMAKLVDEIKAKDILIKQHNDSIKEKMNILNKHGHSNEFVSRIQLKDLVNVSEIEKYVKRLKDIKNNNQEIFKMDISAILDKKGNFKGKVSILFWIRRIIIGMLIVTSIMLMAYFTMKYVATVHLKKRM